MEKFLVFLKKVFMHGESNQQKSWQTRVAIYTLWFFGFFVANIVTTGMCQHGIQRMGKTKMSLVKSINSQNVVYTNLQSEKQKLMNRDRIIYYAQTNLGMILLKPDQLASGEIVKEIKEEKNRKKEMQYAFIDFFNPSINAMEHKR